jgi:hypothetical protein
MARPSRSRRRCNVLGGLSVAIVDCVAASSRDAALVALDSHPDVSVAHLSRALGRSHSATVRLAAISVALISI